MIKRCKTDRTWWNMTSAAWPFCGPQPSEGHAPLVAPLSCGLLRYKRQGKWVIPLEFVLTLEKRLTMQNCRRSCAFCCVLHCNCRRSACCVALVVCAFCVALWCSLRILFLLKPSLRGACGASRGLYVCQRRCRTYLRFTWLARSAYDITCTKLHLMNGMLLYQDHRSRWKEIQKDDLDGNVGSCLFISVLKRPPA